jgi:HD-like signal output (HDOD) protein
MEKNKPVKPDDFISDDIKISSPPTIFLLINEAMNNPRSSVMDIAGIISGDQGLTVRLLRMANSPLYGFPSRIETITQAVTILGIQQINDLVLATTIMKFFEKIPEDLVEITSFWQHSIACGLSARVLATYRREANVERFFVAGTLHDIGRLIIFTKIPEQSLELLAWSKKQGELVYNVERELMGFDHADVGGALLQAWKLPLSIKEMVGFHHKPESAIHFPVETAVIHVSDIIAHAMQLGSSGERFVPPLSEKAWEGIGLSPSILSSAMNMIDLQFNETVKTLKIDTEDD